MDYRHIENNTLSRALKEELYRLEDAEKELQKNQRKLEKKLDKALELVEVADTDKNNKRVEDIEHQIFEVKQELWDLGIVIYDLYRAARHYKTYLGD